MLVLDLVKFLRESILDDTGGSGVAWEDLSEDDAATAQLRWTNEELVSFLNQAEREVARRTQTLIDDTGDYDITTAIGTPDYALSSKVLRLIDVEYDDKPLELLQHKDLRAIKDRKAINSYPKGYTVDSGTRKVTLYPTPDAIYNIAVVAVRYPAIDLSWDTADVTSPEVPEMYHFGLLNYAAHLAYMKDEASALDPSRALTYKSLFDQDFPPETLGREEKKLRNRGRTVQYGGL